MSFFERFIHALLFETGAVLISAVAVLLFGRWILGRLKFYRRLQPPR